ncbi:MAG: ATP-binding protein [Myxococcota bacterium]
MGNETTHPALRRLKLVGEEAPTPPLRKKPPERALAPLRACDVERAFSALAAGILQAAGAHEAGRSPLAVVQELLGARSCFVLKPDAQRELLQVSAAKGRNDERVAAARPGQGVIGRAFAHARVEREPGLWAVPLGEDTSPTGCLAVVDPRFDASDELLHALAAQILASIEVARLRDEALRRTKDLQTALGGLKAVEKSREELLANVSHDLKNPLSTLKTYHAILLHGTLGELSEKQRKAIGTCERNANRLLRMINDLLLVSRLQRGKMQLADKPFGLKTAAEETLQALTPIASRAQVRLELASSPEVYVRGDRERLIEALSTLVENAIHRSQNEGEVTIRVTGHEGLADVSVVDRGEAFDPEDLLHVFEPFYRSKGPDAMRVAGGGLALSLVAKVAHLHGGRALAHADGGETTFRLVLPMFAGAIDPAELAQPPRPGGILLVEDDADCREALQQVLEMEGYRVQSTASATEAKSALEHTRPAMVLLDLRLSEEDGMSVLHFIRATARLADVTVYIISGARDLASLSAGQGLDRIDGFFEKPLQLGKVIDTVAAVVRPSHQI